MSAATSELPDFKTIRRSVSFLGKHRHVDQQGIPHLLLSLRSKQKEEATTTFRKRLGLEVDRASERASVNETTHKLEGGCAENRAEKVSEHRGSFPSIRSKNSKSPKRHVDSVSHPSATRTLSSKDWMKAKVNDATTPLPPPGTIRSQQSHADSATVTEKIHFRSNFRQENDPHGQVPHRNRNYLIDLLSERITGYPATERKRYRLREDEDAATGKVNHSHPHSLQYETQQPHHLNAAAAAAAEKSGHRHRFRHQLSESLDRSSTMRHNQLDKGLKGGSGRSNDPEEGPSKDAINDILKQMTSNDRLKQSCNDPLKQKTNRHLKPTVTDCLKETLDDPLKQTIADTLKPAIGDQSKPAIEELLKVARNDRVKPTIKDQLKDTTEDPLYQTNKDLAGSPSTSFEVAQNKVKVRRTDVRQVQNESKRVVLDLLKGRNRRPGSGWKRFGVAAGNPTLDGTKPRQPSRCGFYDLEDLKRGSNTDEANEEHVKKYIRDNNLMPPDKETWIKQWLRTVSPSIRDEDLDGDPAPPKP